MEDGIELTEGMELIEGCMLGVLLLVGAREVEGIIDGVIDGVTEGSDDGMAEDVTDGMAEGGTVYICESCTASVGSLDPFVCTEDDLGLLTEGKGLAEGYIVGWIPTLGTREVNKTVVSAVDGKREGEAV
jgi:hypothetical protein